jgi:PLP dependent protein
MTIGSLAESTKEGEEDENRDFERLKVTRDVLQGLLEDDAELEGCAWGEEGKLLLSMGMSSDFETALRAGSGIVRVGTGIFGQRRQKGEEESQS